MMSDNPDLSFLVRSMKQLTTDVACLKDGVTVLTALAMSQGGTLVALLTEVRAMHSQPSRFADRVRALKTGAIGLPA